MPPSDSSPDVLTAPWIPVPGGETVGRCGTGCFPLTAARGKVQPERQSLGSRTDWRLPERTGDAMDTVTGLRPLPDQSQAIAAQPELHEDSNRAY